MTLAEGEYSKKRQEKNIDFIPLTLWGSLGKTFASYVKKGDLVNVTGRLKIRSYETDGNKKYSTEVECDDYMMLKKNEKNIEKAN